MPTVQSLQIIIEGPIKNINGKIQFKDASVKSRKVSLSTTITTMCDVECYLPFNNNRDISTILIYDKKEYYNHHCYWILYLLH